jgi:hypothetical protein
MLLLNGPGFLVSQRMFGLLLGLGTWLAWERNGGAEQVAAPAMKRRTRERAVS